MFTPNRFFLFAVILFSIFSIFYVENARASEPSESHVNVEKKIKFTFSNRSILDVLAIYAKASGETIVIDPSVRGTVSIIAPGEVTVPEAFDLLSTSMSLLQFAFVRRSDKLVVESTRNAMHDQLPVVTELPAEKPDQYLTYVYTSKYASSEELYKNLRSLVSRDGEMLTYKSGKTLIMSDWISNLHKIKKVLDSVDVPSTATASHESAPANMKD